jgi:hypothetical protein
VDVSIISESIKLVVFSKLLVRKNEKLVSMARETFLLSKNSKPTV